MPIAMFFCLCFSFFCVGWFATEYIEDRSIFALVTLAWFSGLSVAISILLYISIAELIR